MRLMVYVLLIDYHLASAESGPLLCSERPPFLVAQIQQGAGNFPQGFWSVLTQMQICRPRIHDAKLPFRHVPKVLYWTETW